jgi:hypothetical protein
MHWIGHWPPPSLEESIHLEEIEHRLSRLVYTGATAITELKYMQILTFITLTRIVYSLSLNKSFLFACAHRELTRM